jgi:hypothetical protein
MDGDVLRSAAPAAYPALGAGRLAARLQAVRPNLERQAERREAMKPGRTIIIIVIALIPLLLGVSLILWIVFIKWAAAF